MTEKDFLHGSLRGKLSGEYKGKLHVFPCFGSYKFFSNSKANLSCTITDGKQFISAFEHPLLKDLGNVEFKLTGKTRNGEEIIVERLICNSLSSPRNSRLKIGLTVPTKATIKKGKVENDIQIGYLLNNLDLGPVRNDHSFMIGKAEFNFNQFKNQNEVSQKLQHEGGVIPTVWLFCSKKDFSYRHIDLLVAKSLDFIGFAVGNQISYCIKKYADDKGNYEFHFSNKNCMDYSQGFNLMTIWGHKIRDFIEPGVRNYAKIQKKYRFLHTLQLYFDSQMPNFTDSKAILMSVVFEIIKDAYKKDCKRKGKIVGKNFRQILAQIFKDEKFKYDRKELRFIKRIRNNVVHEGKFKSLDRDLPIYYDQIHLYQRFILHLIGYKGKYYKWTNGGDTELEMN